MQIYRRAITNLTVVGVNYAGFIDVLNPPQRILGPFQFDPAGGQIVSQPVV